MSARGASMGSAPNGKSGGNAQRFVIPSAARNPSSIAETREFLAALGMTKRIKPATNGSAGALEQ